MSCTTAPRPLAANRPQPPLQRRERYCLADGSVRFNQRFHSALARLAFEPTGERPRRVGQANAHQRRPSRSSGQCSSRRNEGRRMTSRPCCGQPPTVPHARPCCGRSPTVPASRPKVSSSSMNVDSCQSDGISSLQTTGFARKPAERIFHDASPAVVRRARIGAGIRFVLFAFGSFASFDGFSAAVASASSFSGVSGDQFPQTKQQSPATPNVRPIIQNHCRFVRTAMAQIATAF